MDNHKSLVNSINRFVKKVYKRQSYHQQALVQLPLKVFRLSTAARIAVGYNFFACLFRSRDIIQLLDKFGQKFVIKSSVLRDKNTLLADFISAQHLVNNRSS